MCIIKTAVFISRICEDYTNSKSICIKKCQNFTEVIFSYENEELITYKIRKDFYEKNIKSFLETDHERDHSFRIKSKPVEIL